MFDVNYDFESCVGLEEQEVDVEADDVDEAVSEVEEAEVDDEIVYANNGIVYARDSIQEWLLTPRSECEGDSKGNAAPFGLNFKRRSVFPRRFYAERETMAK